MVGQPLACAGLQPRLFLSLAFALLEIWPPPGIQFTHRNSPTPQKYLVETMGGGVALLDYNNDGLLDVFFVNSGKLDPAEAPPSDFRRLDALQTRVAKREELGWDAYTGATMPCPHENS
jgi:hypothetical protein